MTMKMFKLFVLILVFASLFYSCKKDTNDNEKPLPPDSIIPTVSLWAGTDTTIALSTLKIDGNIFTISSDNNDIARVTTDNKNLVVNSYKPGKVNVVFKSDQNKTFHILVQPITMRGVSGGEWLSVSKDAYKAHVTVKASDQKFADSLYNALLGEIDDKGEAGLIRYKFYHNNTFSFFNKLKGVYPFKEGTWTYDKLQLTVKYDNKKETYQIIPIPPYPVSFIELKRDLTNQIQQQFPDKGVTEVITHLYLFYYRVPG